jgi:hypothetical protein
MQQPQHRLNQNATLMAYFRDNAIFGPDPAPFVRPQRPGFLISSGVGAAHRVCSAHSQGHQKCEE